MAKMTINDDLNFLEKVSQLFQNQEGKYNEFLMLVKDFKNGRIDTNRVAMRVEELFKGNRDLIHGFNNFLPPGYKIKLDEKKPQLEEAADFLNKIKNRFLHEEHVYKSFLEILNKYRKENWTIEDVYREIAVLFEDHPDLLDEFTYFLDDLPARVVRHKLSQ